MDYDLRNILILAGMKGQDVIKACHVQYKNKIIQKELRAPSGAFFIGLKNPYQ